MYLYSLLQQKIFHLYQLKVPATGIGIFRFLYGIITLQEVCFLLYFQHLIFDPVPYLDVEFPMIYFFLCLWLVVACCITLGYRSQQSILANYVFWIVFVNFTPMQRDFSGGFDLFMLGINFFMIFMPLEKSFSIDNLRNKLRNPRVHYSCYLRQNVSALSYIVPVSIGLGFMYFDSAIHKMFAEHWRNGLGAWLPMSMPLYISPLDMSWFLNQEIIQKTIGYTIIVFQFSFIFLFYLPYLRPVYFFVGLVLHLGITIILNIYPFGLGMLILYCLILPFSWYKKIAILLRTKPQTLLVFYDNQCLLCLRTMLIINHFDIFNRIDFKSVQSHAKDYPILNDTKTSVLLTDLYALDANNMLYHGVNTYVNILIKMRYTALLGYLLKLPVVHQLANFCYRKIADTRRRDTCNQNCTFTNDTKSNLPSLYDKFFAPKSNKLVKSYSQKISKIIFVLFIFQLNSSIHYGIVYRLELNKRSTLLTSIIADVSNTMIQFSHTFFGITPHPLYLHDHFKDYNHIVAITYTNNQGAEKWLPLVTEEGRMANPSWGRVHSMWANIAVTPNIDNKRLAKFIMKTTAFWGIKSELNLENMQFNIKLKKISSPSYWVHNLLKQNLAGTWQTIGTAIWNKGSIKIMLPKQY